MKSLILGWALAISLPALAEPAKEISGTVTLAPGLEKSVNANGVLFIFARKSGETAGMPAAVLRIPQPKFPVTYSLSGANAMMPGSPFDGPFTVTARYSPSGDALDKSGPQGQSKDEKLKPGAKDVKIELKAAK